MRCLLRSRLLINNALLIDEHVAHEQAHYSVTNTLLTSKELLDSMKMLISNLLTCINTLVISQILFFKNTLGISKMLLISNVLLIKKVLLIRIMFLIASAQLISMCLTRNMF